MNLISQHNQQLSEKADNLQGLLVHSLHVIQKIADAVDAIPEAVNKLQGMLKDTSRKKVLKQEFNFGGMIKELIDHQHDILKIRRSDINLSSFGSYFKRVINDGKEKDRQQS